MGADRDEFERAVRWLSRTAPAARDIREIDALKTFLKMVSFEAGTMFHRSYHERTRRPRCEGSPTEAALHAWAGYHPDPRAALRRWADTYFAWLEATHPITPAERAAVLLRQRFMHPLHLSALAAEVGSSRSALARNFRLGYGLSCGQYLARVRLRWFVREIRRPRSNAGRLSELAGFRRYHNLLSALQRATGLTPLQVRELTHDRVRDVIDLDLALTCSADVDAPTRSRTGSVATRASNQAHTSSGAADHAP